MSETQKSKVPSSRLLVATFISSVCVMKRKFSSDVSVLLLRDIKCKMATYLNQLQLPVKAKMLPKKKENNTSAPFCRTFVQDNFLSTDILARPVFICSSLPVVVALAQDHVRLREAGATDVG